MSNKSTLKDFGASYKQKTIPRYNYRQNIGGKLSFSCEARQYGKNSVLIFQRNVASIENFFILGGRLSTRLQF